MHRPGWNLYECQSKEGTRRFLDKALEDAATHSKRHIFIALYHDDSPKHFTCIGIDTVSRRAINYDSFYNEVSVKDWKTQQQNKKSPFFEKIFTDLY